MKRRRVPVGSLLLRSAGVVVAIWLLAPMLVVFPMSLTGEQSFHFPPTSWSTRWYAQLFSDPAWADALVNSLQIALVVMVLATALGTAAAFVLSRTDLPGKALINGLIAAPLVVPVVILAIGIYALFLRWHLVGTVRGFVAAHTALAVPFVVVTVGASLQTFDRGLEAAAASLGASPSKTFWRITGPLILPGILTGAIFSFITSFDELVVSLFLVSPSRVTLPVQMYTSVTREINPTIAAASCVILTSTTIMLVIAAVVLRRRTARLATAGGV